MRDLPKVYLVRADKRSEEFALRNNLAVIGFREVGSLEGARDCATLFEIVEASRPGAKPRAIGNVTSQLWAFAVAMKEGDLAVMPRRLTSQIALGRVIGRYRYQEVGGEMRHTCPVKWERPDVPRSAFERDLLRSFNGFVCSISRNNAQRRVLAVVMGNADPGPSLPQENPRRTYAAAVKPRPLVSEW